MKLLPLCFLTGVTSLSVQTTTTTSVTSDDSLALGKALSRARDIAGIVMQDITVPLVSSTLSCGIPSRWDDFWTAKSTDNADAKTNAEMVVQALEKLGPTYVKFGQALSTRQEIIPLPLAEALSKLHDDMEPFGTDVARKIIRQELGPLLSSTIELEDFLETLSPEPVAAASIGQVYKGYVSGRGSVAVKIQRPGIREMVEQDASLLRQTATWIESIPSLPWQQKQSSLVATKVVDAVDEFMARIREELDYRNEANNMQKFASLYSYQNGTFSDVQVVVPSVYQDLSTDSILIMEWIDCEKLVNIRGEDTDTRRATAERKENLAIIQSGISATLSQLMGTGLMHADPHTGNLVKVRHPDRGVMLGFLDFGLLSNVPESIRDALVCAVAQLVFARDTEAVADLFGELSLLPQEVVSDSDERTALTVALDAIFRDVLVYPPGVTGGATAVPVLRFDKLLGGLSLLVARFQFTLPPYFLNNARALGTLEGLARELDPSFNSLQAVYPYALSRILENPSMSPVVEQTLFSLMKNRVTGQFDRQKIRKLISDTALLSGRSRLAVLRDIMASTSGKRVAKQVMKETLSYTIIGGRRSGSPKKHSLMFQL